MYGDTYTKVSFKEMLQSLKRGAVKPKPLHETRELAEAVFYAYVDGVISQELCVECLLTLGAAVIYKTQHPQQWGETENQILIGFNLDALTVVMVLS